MRTVTLDSYTDVKTRMYIWSCPTCGVVYGIPVEFAEDKKKNGEWYYCPNGHSLSWRESEADKQRKRAVRAEADRDYWQREEKRERERAERIKREKAAVKGQLTKTKKRVANGVCPCCNRQFVNLHRHMSTQHPDFVSSD